MPAGWTTVKLTDIATIQGGGTPSRTESAYFGGDLPWVTPTDLAPIGKIHVLGDVAETLTTAGLANSSAKLIPAGSVLFSSRASIGKIAVTDRDCATNQGFINLTPKADAVCPWFLAYLLRRNTADLIQLAGKTTFLEIPRGKLKDFEIAIPPLPEQRRIVAGIKECMERVEEIERLAAESANSADCLSMAFRHDLWAECADGHALVALDTVAVSSKNGLYKPREHHGAGTVLLRGFNVKEAALARSRTERIQLTERELADYSVVNDDILVSRVNSRALVGKSALVEDLQEPAVHEAMLIRLRVDLGRASPRFLVWLINSPQFLHDLRSRAKHAIGQSSINQKDLLGSKLPLPPIERQEDLIERISNFVPLAGALSTEVSGRQQAIVGLRDVVLRKAFAGDL